jgi:transposase
MMGQRSGKQDRLFYSFNLDEHVPADHLLRSIDRYLDLTDLHQHLEAYYSHTGRPSVDPELMIRMLLVGYCFGIRSERRLCDEVHLNLAYRWFCRLGLEDRVPDHSSFSKNRHGRFRDSDVFRHVFEGVVQRCMTEGLVRAEGFAVDASIIKADANRRRGVPSEQGIDWGNPQLGTRAVREYLQALEEEGQIGTIPKNISLTDPGARWTAAPGCPAFFAYSTNYLVDIHAGVIVDVEATAAHRTEENDATKKMIDRVEERFDLKPQRLIGDTAYGTAAMLNWLINEKQIEPHVPVWDHTQRATDETFPNSDFKWDEQRNEYRCPQGYALRTDWRPFKNSRSHVTKDDAIMYRSRQSVCDRCPMKSQCCPHTPIRKLRRSIHEAARDIARALAKTRRYKQSRNDRKKVEVLFAHLKRILKLDRLRLRGPSGAHDEFLLAATAQNLRRMAKRLCISPPRPTFGAT